MIILITVFLLTLILYECFFGKPKNFPPGPLCLPIVGSSLFVQSKNFHLYLERIKKQYGPVVGFKFGPMYVVAVAGQKEAREVFLREEFQGRPSVFAPPGIMFSEGQDWSVQRRFTIRHLREFGFGKKSIENVILQEAEAFFQNVLHKNEIIQVSGLFTLSAINVLWAMIGGERFSYDDDEFKKLLDCLQKRFRAGNVTGGFLASFPILKKLFPNSKYFRDEIQSETLLNAFLQKAIDLHKKTKTDDPRDFLDVYLTELEKDNKHSSFSEQTLINVCTDLFSAGSESVGNTLGFCLLYCVLYPEWQDKLYEELEKFDTSLPYIDGKEKLPKVEAFLSEVIRCNTIASISVPHKATKDTELNGYFIPKNTTMLISIWNILQDENHWKDPKNFRPERFLSDEGKFKKDIEWLPAFGIGKRICPGETLAKNFIFVYFIALISHFKFSIPEGHPKPSTLCLPGFTNAPQPFEVKITKRF